MLKKISYALLAVLLILVIIGWIGISKFNNAVFRETPNYLTYTAETKPIAFYWNNAMLENSIETHIAISIPVRIAGMPHKFSLQFDTGAPSTLLYGNILASLKAHGVGIKEILKEDKSYVQTLDCTMGGNKVSASTIQILKNYGKSFESHDTINTIKIGTLGADFLDKHITVIDFKNRFIQFYKERPEWMAVLSGFKPFDFTGRRFMLPAEIDGKELELLYDSGSSAFGLITSKHRYDQFTDKTQEEIRYKANRFGEALTVCHKQTDKIIAIGGANLNLERISYVDIYADFQKFMTPFTRIGGWLGNKPFVESTLILDTQKQEFMVIER